jgi:endonuclease/exonuclease/phosphatase family metal-dependent hydrolase
VVWNVHGCVGTDRVFDPQRTAAVLGALAPDVVLLQEVGDSRGVHPPVDQAVVIADALGLGCVVGVTLRAEPFGYGNVTLSRLPVLDSAIIDLGVRGREPRVGLRVAVGRDELRLTTLNVHLGLGPGERRTQLRRLLADGPLPSPFVIAGDFNDFPPGPVSFTLGRKLVDAGAGIARPRTFPSWRPLLRLDRAYLSPALRVRSARVEAGAAARAASDHLPLVIELDCADALQRAHDD